MPGEQARAWGAMMLAGAALGAGYDGLLLLRRALALRAVGTGAVDLLFGALCALGITAAALALGIDPFRWYAFAAFASGMAIYFISIGTCVRVVARSLRNCVMKFNFGAGKAEK